MPSTSYSLLSYLRVVIGVWRDDPRDDATLLARFAEARDETAFATLVWRHGALVWRTCRRILGDTPDAEDAFQATFLALARKAGRFPVESLAGWLHRVARQAALNADAGAKRRRGLEHELRAITQSAAEGDTDRAELYRALDEELAGLPERLRVPLVLHYLEGKSQDEVAQILGCSRSVVRKRLAKGETGLRERLERRGLAVSVLFVGAWLESTATVSAVPARLIGSTARAALRSLLFPLESSPSAALAEGVMKTMLTTKVKLVTVLLGMTLCLAGGGVLAYQALAENAMEPLEPAGEPRREAEASRQPGAAAHLDCYGDPLPAHALARMGTTRLWRRGGWDGDSAVPAFSPDGKTLATHVDYMTVCLWDVATGKEIRRLTKKPVYRLNKQGKKVRVIENIVSLGFSPDGQTLVAMDHNQTVFRWEVAMGKFLRKQQYQGPKRDNVQSLTVAFLPDGKMLGFGNFLKFVEKRIVRGKPVVKEVKGAYVWDVTTSKEICELSRPLKEWEGGRQTAFSPDGKMLVTVANENKNVNKTKAIISLWDVASGKEIRQLTHEDGLVDRVAFSRDGKTLASGDPEKICVWKVATGKQIHRLKVEGTDTLFTFSPDGKTLVGGGKKGHLFDVATGKEIRSFGWEDARVVLFSPDGKILAMGDETGSIRLWEVATGKEIGPRKGYRGSIQWIAYSPDGKTLASLGSQIFGNGGDEKTVRLWEAATGKEIRQLAKGSTFFAYSPDGKMLVSTMDDGMLHLWDTTTGKEIRRFRAADFGPRSATFSPDGKKLAASMRMNKGGMIYLWVWEVATGKKIYSLTTGTLEQDSPLGVVAFSPDGRMLAVDGKDNTVSLWEMATGTRIGQLDLPKQPARGKGQLLVRLLAFSPDGRMLAASSRWDDKVRLWEVASGKEIWQLDGLKNCQEGYTLAFSPDVRMLATAAQGANPVDGSTDLKVHLWEVASGKEIGRLTGHQAPVRTLAFSPDGKTLASGSDDLTCLIWDVTSVGRLKPVPVRPVALRALSKEQLEAAWTDLAKDPAKAYAAIGALQTVPTQAISLLQARVRPVAPVADPKQLKRWIADLDDNNFTVRDKAQQGIENLGEPAIPALRQALKGRTSVEVRRRLNDLLAELEPQEVVVSPKRLRELRAVHVLESLGTAEAGQVLQTWAKGIAEARLTQEANVALARLTKRSAAKP